MASIVNINERLSDDELRSVLWKLKSKRDKDYFGLVCKRWLYLQSTERKKLSVHETISARVEPHGPHMLRKLAARFTGVVKLKLSQSLYPEATDSDLGVIADGFRSLRFLTLWSCRGITDAGMLEIGRSLSSLQHLDVSDCYSLTDKGLSAVAEGCVNLRSLHLAGCRPVTDKVLEALSKKCHNLEELRMQGCSKITDSGLKSFVSGCQLIKWLDIRDCPKITVVGIGFLLDKCHSLKHLDMTSFPHITKAICDEAGLQFPKCCRVSFVGNPMLRHRIEIWV